MNEYLFLFILFLTGAAASFINIVAAGSSFLTLGWMMLWGVDPSMANGTNRIGVIFGTGSGMLAYRSEKLKDFKQSLYFALCAIPGAIIGSYYSIKMDDELFKQVLAVIMILVLITMFLPKSVLTPAEGKVRKSIFIYLPCLPSDFMVVLFRLA